MGFLDRIVDKINNTVDPIFFEEAVGYNERQRFHPQRTQRREGNSVVREIQSLGVPDITSETMGYYLEARALLSEGKFLDYCADLVNDYHAGDTKLVKLMLRASLRVIFNSNSALLHIATTGKAGSGKNDIIENVIELIPKTNVERYATITSKNLWYELLEDVPGEKKQVMNPYHFNHKIICVTEVSDASGVSGIKGFAELNQRTEAAYKATRTLKLAVKGTRALFVCSVSGVQSSTDDKSQVDRRFINNIIADESKQKRIEKVRAVTNSLVNQCNITNDPRIRIAQAGFELLFASQPRFELPSNDVAQMTEDLNSMLDAKGWSPSQMKQIYGLAECGAFEKQFQRGYIRIEKEDLLEAWWLSGYESDEECLLNGEWCRAELKVIEIETREIDTSETATAPEEEYDTVVPFGVPLEEEYTTRMADRSTNYSTHDLSDYTELKKNEWGSWRYKNGNPK